MATEMVEVYNKDEVDYEETFNRKEYKIPARGSITLGRKEAVAFLGNHPGNYVKGDSRYGMDEFKHGKAKMLTIRQKRQSAEAEEKAPEKAEEKAEESSSSAGLLVTCPLCKKDDLVGRIGLKTHLIHCKG